MSGIVPYAAPWQTAAAVLVFIAVIIAFVWERWNRGAVAAGGGLLLILIGTVKLASLWTILHLSTLALVLGMTAMAGAAQKSGLLACGTVWLSKAGKGRPGTTAALLTLATGIASALLDPVAAILTLVPVGLQLGALLGLRRGPLLFAQMLATAVGGAITLNGSPVNMLIAANGAFTYWQILLDVGVPAFLLLLLLTAAAAIVYRGRARPGLVRDALEWRPQAWVRDPILLRNTSIALGTSLLAFLLHHWLPVQPGWVALIAAVVLLTVCRKQYDVKEIAHDIDWRLALSLLGLYIIGAALTGTGAAAALARLAAELAAGSLPLLAVLLLWLSGVLSAALGPLPVAALLVQLVPALSSVLPGTDAAALHPLWWSIALGSSLGAAATPLGAPGHVAALTLAARYKESVVHGRFSKMEYTGDSCRTCARDLLCTPALGRSASN